jgi:proteic killer suppression protein
MIILQKYPKLGYYKNMSEKDIFEVILSENVKKELKKIPQHIQVKLLGWVDDVSNRGISEVRKIPGYHDEPLKGKRRAFDSFE